MKINKQTFFLHLTFIMLSFPALFARGIDLSAGILSWWRCLLGGAFAFLILIISKNVSVNKTQLRWLALTGILMGIHWWTFFASIQFSSIGIGLIALFTYPIITVMLEPLFLKTKATYKQFIGGFGIIAGVFFLIPEFSLSNDITLGVMIGIFSALCLSLRNVLTKKYLHEIPAFKTMAYHTSFAFVVLSLPLLFNTDSFVIPTQNQFAALLILGTVFTLGSHGLMVYSLKHFTAAKIGILGSLQVVYGTFLAFLIFKEIPTPNFYIGVVIIMGVAIFEMLPSKKK